MKKSFFLVLSVCLANMVNGQAITDNGTNVGIGNASPTSKLDVNGSINLAAGNKITIGGVNLLNSIGTRNVHIGENAGNISTGDQNAFIGYNVGQVNTTGAKNTFIGATAGRVNTTGGQNTFLGGRTGFNNTTGSQNSFIGWQAGQQNISGNENTFIGKFAGISNTTGSMNTYIGSNADGSAGLTNATAIGAGAQVTQSNSVILGNAANVGIGTSAPSNTLHVVGGLRLVDGQQGAGKVLVSDANGNATWSSGPVGPTGAQGTTGPQGVQGPQGTTGPTGPLVAGSANQTLRHDGSSWSSSSILTNNGSTIKIGDPNASVSGTTALSVKGAVSGAGVTYLNRFEVESTQSSGSGVNVRIQTNGEGASANHMGIYNQVTGTTGTHYGNYTFLTGSTSGAKYGSGMTISGGTGVAYGYQANVTGSGSNYAAFLSASGGTSNYALYAPLGNAYFADRVGVGTSNPSFPIHVESSTELRNGYFYNTTNSSSTTYGIYGGAFGSGSGDKRGGSFDAVGGTGTNIAVRGTASGGTENYGGYFTGKGYFSDNVGIGTTTPTALLHVEGGKALVGASGGVLATFTVNSNGTDEVMRARVNGTTKMIINAVGNVGIGTGLPSNILSVQGNADFSDNVGFGTSSPAYPVDVTTATALRSVNVINDYSGASTTYGLIASVGGATGTGSRYGVYGSSTAGTSGTAYGVRGYATTEGTGSVYAGYFVTGNATGGGTEYGVYASATDYGLYVGGGKTYLNSSGLLVGTTTAATGYMVSVNGKIMCEELKVQDSGSWPDYVFDKSYQLNSLNEVEKYIEENNHLPGIPDACTVEENGVEIGNMQKLLLQKIEELTLYMIDADKRIKALEAENATLKGH